ncbi:MAG TPA: hypothetical protein VFC74_05785 [Oscillospiraceae bacterium]|nr:hypothetical protein [Oscillospiraceae bacterium]
MDRHEQQLIKLLDLMDAKQIEKVLSVVDADGAKIVMPAVSVARIKQQALGHAKLKKKSRPNKPLAFKLTAASLLLLVFAVAFYGPANTWAQIVKALNFIPGIGKVVDNNKETTRHILAQPIELKLAESTLTVKAISVDQRNIMVVVEEVGDKLTLPTQATLVLGEQEYPLHRTSLSHQQRQENEHEAWTILDWESYFTRYGIVTAVEREGLVRVNYGEEKQVEIPFKLEVAANFTDYAEMGPTASVKGLSVTAIPSLKDNLLKISLLSPPLAGQQVRSYAYSLETLMTLSDQRGNSYPLAVKDHYSLPANEVLFDISGAETKQFILSIPCIVVKQEKEAALLKLAIPPQGKTIVDQTVKLAGHEVILHTVERLDEKTIQLHVTLPQSDLARAQNKDHLVDFDLKDYFNYGYGMHGDDTGRYYKINIPRDAEEISLTLKEPVLAIYGPWEIELDLE